MHRRIYLDRFTSMDDLAKRWWGKPERVLAHMRNHDISRISTFEMNDTLMNTLQYLVASGKLVEHKDEPYPWHKFTVVL